MRRGSVVVIPRRVTDSSLKQPAEIIDAREPATTRGFPDRGVLSEKQDLGPLDPGLDQVFHRTRLENAPVKHAEAVWAKLHALRHPPDRPRFGQVIMNMRAKLHEATPVKAFRGFKASGLPPLRPAAAQPQQHCVQMQARGIFPIGIAAVQFPLDRPQERRQNVLFPRRDTLIERQAILVNPILDGPALDMNPVVTKPLT